MTTSLFPEKVYQGIGASNGYAIARVALLKHEDNHYVEPLDRTIAPDEVDGEIERFIHAMDASRIEIQDLQQNLRGKADARDIEIFDAQLLITDDQMLTREVANMIRKQCKPADYAFFRVIERFVGAMAAMPDSYIKERMSDIRDVAARVLAHLQERRESGAIKLDEQRIVLARDLTPSDTAMLDQFKVAGFAVETGSTTSHSSILARSMQIAAVVGIPSEVFAEVHENELVILDGYAGKLILHPSRTTEALYRKKIEESLIFMHHLASESKLDSETQDGFLVQLSGNIEKPEDVATVTKFGGCGVGLFRTEYLFLNSSDLPTEEAQYQIYRTTLEKLGKEHAVVRTLDIGGDKLDQALQRYAEPNPFLGLRGIRFCLRERRDVLRTQLRALLRAGVHGNLKVMLPMVSSLEEVLEFRTFLAECQAELKQEKQQYVERLSLGVMIETPAAALCAAALAKQVDFFSIGTNDLVQYTLAIDRTNERLSYLYKPTHPAVLNLIAHCIEVAHRHNIWVSVCGQIAGDPRYTPLLVGLGVHELSMPPAALGPVRRVVRKIKMAEAREAAWAALRSKDADAAMTYSVDLLKSVAPEIANLLQVK